MDRKLNFYIPALLFLFITAMLPYLPGLVFDNRDCWEVWAHYIKANGLRNAYGSSTDYMPVYQYFLWFYDKITGSDRAITEHIPYLRCITLAFDYLGIWIMYQWIDKKLAYYALLALCILNLAYCYNTIFWGQMDGTLATLVFLAVYLAWKGNNFWSAVFMVLAFNFKIQSIIIIPVWALLYINNYFDKRNKWAFFSPFLAAIAVQLLLIAPFLRGNYGISAITGIILHSFNKYPTLSIRAANFWQWLYTGVRYEKLLYAFDYKEWFAGFTYKQVGLILFFGSSFLALRPMLRLVWINRKNTAFRFQISRELVWATAAMVYMLFYFFNTEIHERYCHPAFIFITAYAFFTGDFFVYVLFSIMYFLTLEFSMQHFHFQSYESIFFNLKFLAAINALIILSLAHKIKRHFKTNYVLVQSAFPTSEQPFT